MSRLTLVVLGACIAMAAAGCSRRRHCGSGGSGYDSDYDYDSGSGSGSDYSSGYSSGSGCKVGNGVPVSDVVEAGFDAALNDDGGNYDFGGYDPRDVDSDVYNGPDSGYTLGHTPHGCNHHRRPRHHIHCSCRYH